MADSEERPAKIRKLEPSEEAKFISENGFENLDYIEQIESVTNVESAKPGSDEATTDTPALSKSQLKKLRKAQEWESGKDYRKAKRREKHKEKQARKAEARSELLQKIAKGEVEAKAKNLHLGNKIRRPGRPIQLPVALILDCGFNELMTDKELVSLGAQLTRCYSDNKHAAYRAHISISSWGGSLRERFETVLTSNHLGWKGVRFFEEDFVATAGVLDEVMRSVEGGKVAGALCKAGDQLKETAPGNDLKVEVSSGDRLGESSSKKAMTMDSIDHSITSNPGTELANPIMDPTTQILMEDAKPGPKVVYLTSDSPHTLTNLEPYTSYIIGGIVDKNRHKGLCYKRACERGIATAKLPIGEYMTMQSRSVLAVNHVVEIMLNWLDTGNWGESFLRVIPKRKEAKLKPKGESSVRIDYDDEDEGVEEEEDEGDITLPNKPDIDVD